MNENLRRQGARYGLEFTERTRLSNSRPALEAGEFAREAGKFAPFHGEIFRAYFTAGRDIGDLGVLLQVAETCGLDAAALAGALKEGRYARRLAANQAEARQLGIRSVPTFIINGRERLVGAQPLAKFREFLAIMASEA